MTERYVILPLMNKFLAALCAALLVAAAVPAQAVEWTTMGPRAMGMGGAGVALAQGPLAAYWNPAALGRATENSYGFAAPVSAHGALTGDAVAGAKDLQNAFNTCPGLTAAACNSQIQKAIGELDNPNNGLRIDGTAGGNIKIGKIDVFANGFLDVGATPLIDKVNTTQATIANNTSALIVRGARILELGAGYGHELPFAPGVLVGGDVKYMHALVGVGSYGIVSSINNTSKSDIINTLKSNESNSSNVGVDAGALWEVDRTFENAWWSPKVGVTGRNLNNPKFAQPILNTAQGSVGGGRFSVNPTVRMGAAITPLHFWNLAADLDLTNNTTRVDNVKSRQLGLGTEVNVFNRSWINIPLRFGLARNLSASTNMITAGVGLNFLHLMVDISGEASPKRIDTQTQGDSTKIPQEFGASVQLSLLFGGSEEEHASSHRDEQPVPTEKVKTSNDLPPAQTDKVKADADKAQQELNKESAQPGK